MEFEKAIEELFNGKKIRSDRWSKEDYIYWDSQGGTLRDENCDESQFSFTHTEIQSDWEIVKEKLSRKQVLLNLNNELPVDCATFEGERIKNVLSELINILAEVEK